MSDFVAGLNGRADAAGAALRHAFAVKNVAFAPRDILPELKSGSAAPKHFSPADSPKHFAPADRDSDPTEGWDPFDAEQAPTAFVDPVEAAHAAGYAEGVAAALAESAANAGRDRALVEELVAAMTGDARMDRERFAAHLRQTVLHLVTRMVGEAGVDGALLERRVQAAAGLLADDAESAMLRVHPDDLSLIDGKLPPNVVAAGDAHVARGSFVLESASTTVEDGPDLWLSQLAQAIDRAALPE